MKKQAKAWKDRDDPDVAEAARRAEKSLTAVEERLTQPKFTHETDRLKMPGGLDAKLGAIPEVVASADTAPTTQSREVFAELRARADAALLDLDRIVGDEVAELNAAIARSGLAVVEA